MQYKKPHINLQIAFLATVFTAFIFIFLFFYIGVVNRKNSYDDSKLLVKEMSRKAAIETENFFMAAFMTARSLAQRGIIYRKLGADRMEIVEMMRTTLKRSPNFLAIWTMWEPNAYDAKDYQYKNSKFADAEGHLSVTFFRHNDSIYMEFTEPKDYLDDYYTIPTQSKSELIIEPYHYVYEGFPFTFYETSVVVPFFTNSNIAGVFAIDLDLEFLQKKLNDIKIYQSGYLSLISFNGEIVSHKDSSHITKNFYKIINPNDSLSATIIRNGLEYSLETTSEFTGKKVFRFFYPILMGNGKNPWSIMVEIPIDEATTRSKELLYTAFGTLILGLSLIIYLIINIFDRKKYEKYILESYYKVEESNRIISESERNYREIFNSTQEAIFIHDPNTGKVIDVNDMAVRMFGYHSKQEMLANSIGILSASITPYSDYEASQYFKRTIIEGLQIFEWQAQKKNGENFWVEVSLNGSVVNGVGRILAVARDITEKRKSAIELEKYKNHLEFLVKERTQELASANEELNMQREELQVTLENLQQAQRNLVQSEKMASLGILAAGVAHEINNPLNFISGGINGLDSYIKDYLSDDHKNNISPYVDAIFEGVKRSTAIVNSMNQYSSRDDISKDSINIHNIIENCLVMLNNHIKDRISISINLTNDIFNLKGSEGKLHQALLNILTNSVQAINQKGSITIATTLKNRKLHLAVTDSGCGISNDKISRIFDPFFTTKDPGEGTGLGLYITYNIIKEHKGTIDFESIEGVGTTVRIALPVSSKK
jgi:PAS domain S-box-containing protein